MSNPLQNEPPKRASTEEKARQVYDLLGILLNALLSIFGKRHDDR